MSNHDSGQPFVGREEELTELGARLETHQLVTIVGPPGVGKSRLAREALQKLERNLALDVTDLRDAAELHRLLASSVGVSADEDSSLVETLTDTLRRRGDVAILLDGFDPLVREASESLGPLVSGAQNVTWIVTSRERLRLPDEHPFGLSPMSAEDAMSLFAERARQTSPDFAMEESREAVARLIERLDSNPLAIELATARLRTFSPSDLLQRLDRRFALLRSRGGVSRPSLADAIELSWELLDRDEQDCLWQCSVFRGGFDLDAAEAVVELGEDAPWVLDVLESLVDKSLLDRQDAAGSAGRGRLRLSESIRDFAVGKHSDDEATALRRRHADVYVQLGRQWRGLHWTADELDRAASDIRNMVAVVERFGEEEPELSASAALSLDAVFRYRGMTELHLHVLEQGIEAARRAEDDTTLAALLGARAELGVVTGRLERAAEDAAEATEIARSGRDWETWIRSEVQRAEVERRTGHAREALTRLEELDTPLQHAGREVRRYVLAHRAACHAELGQLNEARDLAMHIPPPDPEGDVGLEYSALKRLAYAHYYLGSHEHQHRLNREALELARRVGDRRRMARARQGLGDAAFARGDYREVRDHYEAALEVHRELGNDHLAGVLLGNLGTAEHRIDEFDDAARHYEDALALHQQTGARPYEAVVSFALGVLEHERGHLDDAAFRYDRAAELFGELRQPDDVVATQVCRAWLELTRQDWEAAERSLDWAEVSAPREWLTVVEGSRRLLTVLRGDGEDEVEPIEPPDDDSLPALLAGGLASLIETGGRSVDTPEDLSSSLQGRLLVRLATGDEPTRTPRQTPTPSREDVVVGSGGEWFQIGDQERVNLRRRRAHRLILDQLMSIYERDPGDTLDVYDAFEIGWEGESATPETAAERVYWVVGTLRKLGLEGILLTSDAGYYLDPDADVKRADPQALNQKE